MNYLTFIFIIYYVQSAAIPNSDDTELVLVNVIFRHGARTTYAFYPTDPNRNETFYPIGLGGLTNDGKLGEFKLGHYLKNLYGEFLGDDYTEEKVYVRSTDVTRTKMSAQLVLAGLFPPSKIQMWKEDLLWQPIPISYKPEAEEDIFHPWTTCSYKSHVISQLPNVSAVQELYVKPYASVYAFIEENSGKPMNHPADMQDIFFIFKTESDMGLEIPEWVHNVYPEPAHSIASQVYGYHNYDLRVKHINSGYLLKKILQDSEMKIAGDLKYKILLYSGHESTLGYMLNALNVYEAHVPPYGSALSFEVHRRGEQYFIKLRYRNDTDATDSIDLQLPGCEVLCPFEKFIELVQDLVPSQSIQDACSMDLPDNSL